MRLLVFSAFLLGGAEAGFDWGAGCEGGSGQFTTSLGAGATVDVGEIPAGKWTVVARIPASSDVDVQFLPRSGVVIRLPLVVKALRQERRNEFLWPLPFQAAGHLFSKTFVRVRAPCETHHFEVLWQVA